MSAADRDAIERSVLAAKMATKDDLIQLQSFIFTLLVWVLLAIFGGIVLALLLLPHATA